MPKDCYYSVTKSCLTLRFHEQQLPGFPVLHRLLEFTQTHPLSHWCHPTLSSFVVLFSFCLQSFSVSGSFPVSQLFPSGGQHIASSASVSILPMNIQGWFFKIDCFYLLAVERTLKSLLSPTIRKHQFFGVQPSLWSNSHIRTWLLEKP